MALPSHRSAPLASEPFSSESYFQSQPAPPGVEDAVARVSGFVEKWMAVKGKKVVLVTSGGTTVPLEANTVRFLDNFSAGTRGATSAEYFLSAGYAVIFMHRTHSLRPFSRHYSHSLNPFLDLLTTSSTASGSNGPSIVVSAEHSARLLPVLEAYRKAQQEETLLSIEFQTINEYLWLLKGVTEQMCSLGRRGMFYLAAAVSDFFLPEDRIAEHKIQSARGTLSLEMDQVPKVLRPLVQEWTPEGYIVSFKLETEAQLLIPKARAALSRYGHQLVIGNDLHRRKYEVVFVERAHPSAASRTPQKGRGDARISGAETPPISVGGDEKHLGPEEEYKETWFRLDELKKGNQDLTGDVEIEQLIVRELVGRHDSWITAKG